MPESLLRFDAGTLRTHHALTGRPGLEADEAQLLGYLAAEQLNARLFDDGDRGRRLVAELTSSIADATTTRFVDLLNAAKR